MGTRLPSPIRRDQIVMATLELLGEMPVERLGTRAVAERVGVTQPALFRHFSSKDEMLEAVARHAVSLLGGRVETVLAEGLGPVETIHRVSRGLLEFAQAYPGVLALLFHDVAQGDGARFHAPLRHLVSMQVSLVTELARRTADEEGLPASVDPAAAAALFVATIQGVLLQWRHGRRDIRPAEDSAQIVEWWLTALRGGQPTVERSAPASAAESVPAPAMPAAQLRTLDVRAQIAGGDDPLDAILGALRGIGPRGVLILVAPFRPAPLLTLLGGEGWRTFPREAGNGLWVVEIVGEHAPDIRDLSDLEAPEPMEQVLLATGDLADDDALFFRLPRVPEPLLPHLARRGLSYGIEEEPGGGAILLVKGAAS